MNKRYLYQFVGGAYNGQKWRYAALETRNLIKGYTKDWSEERVKGILCPREELDNQPIIDGYLSPTYDGVRYIVDGKVKSDWQCTEEEKAKSDSYHVIRYETKEVYDVLSR
ncbi:MAG: hypothetical protein NC253_07880 [Ruminococcus sp.]|nr:hypothetical protein [Ruminococcus sp.]MCM1480750.1 hypothetical protein [Muribaculaceae bacterium]